jgi:hypothetical protein
MAPPLFPPADRHSHSLRRRWLGTGWYWLFQLGGWGLFWLVLTLGSLTSDVSETIIRQELVAQSVFIVSLVFCSHLLRVQVLYLRHLNTTKKKFLLGLFVAVIFTSAAVIGPWVFWGVHGEDATDLQKGPAELVHFLVFLFGVSLMLTVWVCFYFGYHYFRRYQQGVVEHLRLDAAVKEAELRALRAQVNPHFFFNSLNTLRALIPKELERPREAVTLLADLLRASLTVGQHRVVTLAEELETVRNYLALEQLRFETRLRVHLAISPDTLGLRLPPFVLQTLVENAIKYGISPYEDGGDITIISEEQNGSLALTVRNRGILAQGSASIGLGLNNARSRLKLVCGSTAQLAVTQDGDQVLARVVAPQTVLFTTSNESSHR